MLVSAAQGKQKTVRDSHNRRTVILLTLLVILHTVWCRASQDAQVAEMKQQMQAESSKKVLSICMPDCPKAVYSRWLVSVATRSRKPS